MIRAPSVTTSRRPSVSHSTCHCKVTKWHLGTAVMSVSPYSWIITPLPLEIVDNCWQLGNLVLCVQSTSVSVIVIKFYILLLGQCQPCLAKSKIHKFNTCITPCISWKWPLWGGRLRIGTGVGRSTQIKLFSNWEEYFFSIHIKFVNEKFCVVKNKLASFWWRHRRWTIAWENWLLTRDHLEDKKPSFNNNIF